MAVIRGTDRAIPDDVTKAARAKGFKEPDVYSGSLVVKRSKVEGRYGGTAKAAAKLGNGNGRGGPAESSAKASQAGKSAKKGNGIVARALGRWAT